MDELLKEVEQFGDLTGAFTVLDMFVVLMLSFILCLVLGFIYRYTHKGVSYSQSYVQTLVVMGVTIALIMLIVGSNIARAFALVGALSIVRFRNAMKETKDIGFIFMAMKMKPMSLVSFIALRNRTMDRAPTRAKARAMLDPTMSMMSAIVTPITTRVCT